MIGKIRGLVTGPILIHKHKRFAAAQETSGVWQFLALRESIIDEWTPRGGIELCLIDHMTHCYTATPARCAGYRTLSGWGKMATPIRSAL